MQKETNNGNRIMVANTAKDETDFLVANLGSMVALTLSQRTQTKPAMLASSTTRSGR